MDNSQLTAEEHLQQMQAIYDKHVADIREIERQREDNLMKVVTWFLEQNRVPPDPDKLTKRELFAMAAMQGIASQKDDRYWTPSTGKTVEEWQTDALRADAAQAVRMADALLAELEKGNG